MQTDDYTDIYEINTRVETMEKTLSDSSKMIIPAQVSHCLSGVWMAVLWGDQEQILREKQPFHWNVISVNGRDKMTWLDLADMTIHPWVAVAICYHHI